jgi:hypothetical protein
MARVVVNEYVSVDGVMEDPGGAEEFELGGWTRPYWSDERGRVQLERLRTLVRHDLMDEYHVMVHPVVLGKGKRLFAEGANKSLAPVEVRTLDTGVMLVVFQPASAR